MKLLLLIILFPFAAFAQTVHVDDGEVKYKGDEKFVTASSDISTKMDRILADDLFKRFDVKKETSGGAVQLKGNVRLTTPYSVIRKMFFEMTVNPASDGFSYTIDNVYLVEQRRGGREKMIPSKEMIGDLEDAGKQAADLEKTLNEFDMRIQQLLAALKN